MAAIGELLDRVRANRPLRTAPKAFVILAMTSIAETTMDFMLQETLQQKWRQNTFDFPGQQYIVREYASRKIRANIVAPGPLDTQFAGPNGGDELKKKMIGEHTALVRCGEAEYIGPLIAALRSDDCRWANVQRIEATGGVLI